MDNSNKDSNAISSESQTQKEEKLIRLSLTQLCFEVKGYDMQEAITLMRKAWWFYLLMLLALILLILVIIYLKDSVAVLITSLVSRFWLKNRSP